MKITIHLPPCSDDKISSDLRYLTEILDANGIDTSGGILGGEYGYGADFENDVFMLHKYCWCEREDCPWCAGCECPESAFHYFVDGAEVNYKKYDQFFDKFECCKGHWLGEYSDFGNPKRHQCKKWNAKADEANGRREMKHDKACRYCQGEFGNAPNFLHKKSGTTAHWYKYIGRDMKIDLRGNWQEIFNECLDSLKKVTPTRRELSDLTNGETLEKGA